MFFQSHNGRMYIPKILFDRQGQPFYGFLLCWIEPSHAIVGHGNWFNSSNVMSQSPDKR